MNIALIHYLAPPTIGGVESVIAHHARLMANDGHNVRVIAGSGGVFDRRIQFFPIPLVSSRHTAVLDAKTDLDKGNLPENFPELVKELKSKVAPVLEKADVVIAHNVCSLHKNLALTVALHEISQEAASPRFILWHHDLAWTSSRYEGELHPGYPWDLLRTMWPNVTQVAISDLRRKELSDIQGISAKRIQVIPSGLDVAEMLKLGSVARALVKDLNLLDSAPILLLPVRITKRKNIELALKIVSQLAGDFPKVKLVITGPLGAHNPANSQYFEDLKNLKQVPLLANRVVFLAEQVEGFLPDEVIHDLYRLADALLLPSFEEGFGIPILEAGLSGVPIFCSNIPTLKAIGGDDAHYFSPNSDPGEVASLIGGALNNSQGYRLRARVKQNYTWDAIYTNQISPLLEGVHVP